MLDKIYNGIIYKICSPNTDLVYIGYTTGKLVNRFHKHKNAYKRYLDGDVNYNVSFAVLEFGSAYIVDMEHVTGDLNAIKFREKFYVTNTINTVNDGYICPACSNNFKNTF
jgi:hypothetical protein